MGLNRNLLVTKSSYKTPRLECENYFFELSLTSYSLQWFFLSVRTFIIIPCTKTMSVGVKFNQVLLLLFPVLLKNKYILPKPLKIFYTKDLLILINTITF